MGFHKGVLQLNSTIYASLIFIYQSCWNWLFSCCCAVQERKAETYQLSQNDLGISSSIGVVKGIIALFQLYSIVGYISTEKHEKNRINDYAAYQLTMIPYGLMSVVNILCGMVTPTYSAIYMVNSTVMKEAHDRGWTFDGTVGELCEDTLAVGEEGCVGFETTFEGDPGVGPSNEGEEQLQPEVNNDQTRGIETTSPPEANKREVSKIELNTGSKEEIKVRCPSIISTSSETFGSYSSWRVLWQTVRQTLSELPRRAFLIRCFTLKDQDPGKEYIKSLLHSMAGKVEKGTTQIVIPPIGNPTFRMRSWWHKPMLAVSDLIILVSLALPYVIIWKLTKFEAPAGRKLQGGVFMSWLVIGQILSASWRNIWRIIQSRIPRVKNIEYYSTGIYLSFGVAMYSIPAIWGFILVGKEKYRHPDDGAPRG